MIIGSFGRSIKGKSYMNSQAKVWLEFASVDLQTIDAIIANKNLTPAVAFHAQQAIEKTLKAIIVNFGNEIPRIHDLVTLTSKAGELLNIQIDHRTLVLLNQAYSRARYPMELSQDDMAIPSERTAELFYSTAKKLYEEIKDNL